ncbi:MAG: 6-pyruvoyl tetrahydropterin synthase family protein [Planctomycetes bacterium]|nr:6-pyruvoyl tetrahydropterin synthase family protein [Planctomycetota bacterium]
MPASAATQLSIMRQLTFCAGHRLLRHEGKCAFFHGHNYKVDVEVAPRVGGAVLDDVGRIVDFSVIKRRLLGWIDEHWDHGFIVSAEDTNGIAALNTVEPNKTFVLPYNPTAENMARYLLEVVAPEVLGDLPIVVTRMVVWETDTSCATATR